MTVRVLINGLHAKSGGGVTYLRQMLTPLSADPDLDVHLLIHREQANLLAASTTTAVTVHYAAFRPGFVREMAWEQLCLPRFARRLRIDTTFSPANFGPLLAPGGVVLLRNALAVGAVDRRPIKRLYWAALSVMTFLSLLFSRRAMAVSDYARQTLARPASLGRKVVVVHHGVDAVFRGSGPAAPREGFLLAVADLYVQKNLLILIDAMARLRTQHPALTLKIAGAPVDAAYAALIEDRIAQHGLGDAVTLLGPLPRDALADLYRRCAVFVFPSRVETFGQPLAEAMAAGAPIACADATAMPEVLGDTGLYFDPADPSAVEQAIDRLLCDPALAQRLGAAAAARASRFDWRHTAAATAAVLKLAARDPSTSTAPHGYWLATAWTWVIGVYGLYAWQFRDLIGPILSRLGLA